MAQGWAEGSVQGTAEGLAQSSAEGLAQSSAEGLAQSSAEGSGLPRVGALDSSRSALIQRAVRRARDAGASLELIADSADSVLENADILVATTWPPADEMTTALAGMATGQVVIVLETESTAGWPALDPQTWQPRGWTGQPPIVVSIDPRDEEHSLAIALRRLASDPELRRSLGSAARAWSRQHSSLEHAVHAWRSILAEAVTVTPPPRPPDWPRHLTADGTERVREVLAEFGTTVDFLR
jgi:glycosyltransferase involved in cell wall biosynthesis